MKMIHCKNCDKIITTLEETNIPTICCGKEMEVLVANTADAAKEKHVPVMQKEKQLVKVSVGQTLHPMEIEHYIHFIAIETKTGFQVHYLKPGDQPIAKFMVVEQEEIINVYAYCDKHGLWKQVIKNNED